MAHFYGTLKGSRGEATRCGTKRSGVHVQAAGWSGCGEASVFQSDAAVGADRLHLNVAKWCGVGQEIVCYNGAVEGEFDVYANRGSAWRKILTTGDRETAAATAKACDVPAVVVPAGCFFQGF